MKRLIGFLALIVLVGCTCLGQVATQEVFATQTSCEVPLPDYTQIVPVNDNCEVASYTQAPVAGTLLSPANPTVNVLLEVIDVSGNVSQATFNVVLRDTIAPTFNFPPEMLVQNPVESGTELLALENK